MTFVVLLAFIHTLPTLSLLSLHPILLWHQGPPTSKAQRTEFASCVRHTTELDKQTDCSWQKGVQEKLQFSLFLYRNSFTKLTEIRSLIMHNKPPSLGQPIGQWQTKQREFLPHAPHFTPWKYTEAEGMWQLFLWAELRKQQKLDLPCLIQKETVWVFWPHESMLPSHCWTAAFSMLRMQDGANAEMDAACTAHLISCPQSHQELSLLQQGGQIWHSPG